MRTRRAVAAAMGMGIPAPMRQRPTAPAQTCRRQVVALAAPCSVEPPTSAVPGDPGGGASALEAALPLVAPPAPVAAAVVSAPSPVTTGPGACGGAGGGPSKTGGGPSKTDGGPSVTGGGASAAAVAPMSAPAAEGKDDMLSSPAEDAVEPARVSRPAEDNGFGEPLSPPPCEGVAIAS